MPLGQYIIQSCGKQYPVSIRVILTQWDFVGSWSPMNFHWLICIQFNEFFSLVHAWIWLKSNLSASLRAKLISSHLAMWNKFDSPWVNIEYLKSSKYKSPYYLQTCTVNLSNMVDMLWEMHICELYPGRLYSSLYYSNLPWHSNCAIFIRVNSMTCLESHAIFSGWHPMFASHLHGLHDK